jgi:hypothetical protein
VDRAHDAIRLGGGGRCIVPASAFSEPDRNTSKPVINRWFGRTDGKPFFFAGVWREWTGDVGTIKEPNVGKHRKIPTICSSVNFDLRILPPRGGQSLN